MGIGGCLRHDTPHESLLLSAFFLACDRPFPCRTAGCSQPAKALLPRHRDAVRASSNPRVGWMMIWVRRFNLLCRFQISRLFPSQVALFCHTRSLQAAPSAKLLDGYTIASTSHAYTFSRSSRRVSCVHVKFMFFAGEPSEVGAVRLLLLSALLPPQHQ